MARRCFYSFYFNEDNWRAAKVRNIGTVEGNKPATGNIWEIVKSAGDEAIKRWIAAQMKGKSCVIVLVGTNTVTRKWVKHEIIKGWDDGLGVVGIHIHGLKDAYGYVSHKGNNPFSVIGYGNTGKKLSSIVKCYDPPGSSSQERYAWISKHLANAVEEAVRIRNQH